MLNIDIRSDLRQVAARFQASAQAKIAPAIARALNRTATTVRKEAAVEIRKAYHMPAATAKSQITLTRANARRLEVVLTASGKPLPLISFGARQTQKGVTVQVKRRGGRKLIPHAFITTVGGHRGVFLRTEPGRKRVMRRRRIRPGPTDLPISELLSVSVPGAFGSKAVFRALERVARARFGVELARELKFRTRNG